jgi:hypothetical protein
MFDRRFIAAIESMDALQRTALFHALVCHDCLASYLRIILVPGALQPNVSMEPGGVGEREAEALKCREEGLARWGSGCYPADAQLFLSAELFAALGRRADVGRSKSLLSLYFAEREDPLSWHIATLSYQGVVMDLPLDHPSDQLLYTFVSLSQARTWVALGRREEGARLLRLALHPDREDESEGARIDWLVARVKLALGEEEVAARALEGVLERLVNLREPAACALALLDLAPIYARGGRMRALEAHLQRLRRQFADSEDENYLGQVEPLVLSMDSAAVEALARGVREAIPSFYRFFFREADSAERGRHTRGEG